MLFYCIPGKRHRVAEALRGLGFQDTEFAFATEGVRTWSYVEPD